MSDGETATPRPRVKERRAPDRMMAHGATDTPRHILFGNPDRMLHMPLPPGGVLRQLVSGLDNAPESF